MSYRLVKGEFHLFYKKTRRVGSRPDGDSVWFKPDEPDLLMNIGNPPRSTHLNGGGFAQLRFEGIDALELHYNGSNHQNKQCCVSARDRLLKLLGFQSVTYAPNDDIPSYVRDSSPKKIDGYILTRNIDPFQRPVSFVFQGKASASDGADIWLDVKLLKDSVNAKLMAEGEVYPGYYTGLPTDLRNHLTNDAIAARGANKGLWSKDSSLAWNQIASINALTPLAIWPKLYRRLFSFFKAGNNSITAFEAWLRQDSHERDDQIWIISEAHLGNIHDIFEVSGTKIQMLYHPEELVIVPR